MTLSEKLNKEFDLFRSIKMQQPKCSVFCSSFEIELRKRICKYLITNENKITEENKKIMALTPNLLDEAYSYLRDQMQISAIPDENFNEAMESWLHSFCPSQSI